jgi:hypothetical protein
VTKSEMITKHTSTEFFMLAIVFLVELEIRKHKIMKLRNFVLTFISLKFGFRLELLLCKLNFD